MRRKRLVILLGSTCLVLMLAVLPFMVGCAKAPPAPAPAPAPTPAPAPAPAPTVETITLKAVTFQPANNPTVARAFMLFKDRVNERANGELTIDYIGGPETIGMFDQGLAAQEGVVDIVWTPGVFYRGIVPELKGLAYTQLTPHEERERGAYDFMLDLHKKGGLFYLGRGWVTERQFNIFTNKKVETPYDLAGQKIGPGGIHVAFMEALGATPVTMLLGDMYTGMERGVIDGFAYPLSAGFATGWHLHEVTKYIVDHPFYVSDVCTIINLDRWNSLPKNLQNLLTEVQVEMEAESPSIWAELLAEERDVAMEAGLEAIEFSPADAEWYIQTAYRAAWEEVVKKSPEVGSRLKELLTK